MQRRADYEIKKALYSLHSLDVKAAGLGVAMENGIDKVKAIANYVTDTNDNDGVAKAIEKFVLNK